MDQKPFAVFPISLLNTIRLIGSLSWLQLLYAVSFLARPFWNTRREFPPFNRVISHTETRIINTFLGTAPLSAYSSTTAERQWYLSSGNDTLNHAKTTRTTSQPIPHSLATSTWPQQGHQDSESSSSEQDTPTSQPDTENSRANSPIYQTVRKLRSSTRGSISKIASSAKSIFRQPLTVLPRNLDGSALDEERAEPDLVPVPVRTSQPHFVQNTTFSVPMSASARVADHFSDPGPSIGIKVQQPVSFGATIDAVVNSETVQMNRTRKYHSIESYPGKFPVSDAMNYSSLATAYAVRGRGTTSVRPFSDY
ncbi:hypothetical protein Pdw03_0982 [Penicillium digitatum]|uniref:Uncharacterized protein n=3 Tax=Penicillium digitatum TaxID=36651 RepID=K9FCJ6_PEND2|nr:hypothetical protein PDIP_44220 [Penicillium digitatum Pd1]EKV07100.1 hypothetical protein PDIG_73740 [Penicillium digitatum PHI26]EKV14378.1 hypothetical protein PDIP_44220 [Penicillium digitatum Pd1]KAG0159815.1 hypothetical protein PDIDSM_7342 [Penicillium digitatum]QQK46084.1 hypothetical protein Pdw03_0982 [Penicillium digitatum]